MPCCDHIVLLIFKLSIAESVVEVGVVAGKKSELLIQSSAV
jgi:hypothetical protein